LQKRTKKRLSIWLTGARPLCELGERIKVFWLFFAKKNCFPCFFLTHSRHMHRENKHAKNDANSREKHLPNQPVLGRMTAIFMIHR
jgi:hypothetical protein